MTKQLPLPNRKKKFTLTIYSQPYSAKDFRRIMRMWRDIENKEYPKTWKKLNSTIHMMYQLALKIEKGEIDEE